MPRKYRKLGKRSTMSGRRGGGSARKYRKRYRSGNVRTGGLYRLRGRTGLKSTAELKFYDRALAGQNPGGAGNINNTDTVVYMRCAGATPINSNYLEMGKIYSTGTLLDYLKCDNTGYTRIGRKIVIKSLLMDLLVTVTNNNVNGIGFKAWLVLDKQCNGEYEWGNNFLSQPAGAPAQVTGGAGGAGTPITYYWNTQLPSIANRQRFQILKEWRWTMQATVANGANGANVGETCKWLKHYQRMNLPIEYGGTTGAIGEIKSNNLIFLISGTETPYTDSSATFTIGGSVRIRFNDS